MQTLGQISRKESCPLERHHSLLADGLSNCSVILGESMLKVGSNVSANELNLVILHDLLFYLCLTLGDGDTISKSLTCLNTIIFNL